MLTRYRLCVSACSEGDHLHNPRWFAGRGEGREREREGDRQEVGCEREGFVKARGFG